MAAVQVGPAFKSAAYVGGAFLMRQIGLRWGRPAADQAGEIDRLPLHGRDHLRQFGRLVETAFAQAQRVQGQRHDAVEALSLQLFAQSLAESASQRKFAGVLVGMDQAVERKIVAPEGKSRVEVGWLVQATAAAFAVRRRFGALWAAV